MIEGVDTKLGKQKTKMTPREQLIQEVMQAPDFLVNVLLKLLCLMKGEREGVIRKLAQFAQSVEPEPIDEEAFSEQETLRLVRKGSALVANGELPNDLDVNQWMSDLREARIQEHIEF